MKAKTNGNPKWKDIQQTQTVTSPPSAPGGGLTGQCLQHKVWGHCPVAEQIRQEGREKVLDEYNDELLTKLVQELAGTWRMRDAKLFSIIRKYRLVPIGAMKAELRQKEDGKL